MYVRRAVSFRETATAPSICKVKRWDVYFDDVVVVVIISSLDCDCDKENELVPKRFSTFNLLSLSLSLSLLSTK